MIHTLKTDPIPFLAIERGTKTFELRRHDRPFGVLDILHLRETKASAAEMAAPDYRFALAYTGVEMAVRIVGMLPGPAYGLQAGFAILSIVHLASFNQRNRDAVLAGLDWNTTVNGPAEPVVARGCTGPKLRPYANDPENGRCIACDGRKTVVLARGGSPVPCIVCNPPGDASQA